MINPATKATLTPIIQSTKNGYLLAVSGSDGYLVTQRERVS
jgi:hypothetical protein